MHICKGKCLRRNHCNACVCIQYSNNYDTLLIDWQYQPHTATALLNQSNCPNSHASLNHNINEAENVLCVWVCDHREKSHHTDLMEIIGEIGLFGQHFSNYYAKVCIWISAMYLCTALQYLLAQCLTFVP